MIEMDNTEEYGKMHRRPLIVFILFISIITIFPGTINSNDLYIFLPNDQIPFKLKSKLTDYFSGINLMVFGDIMDFKLMVESRKPEAIITKRLVVDLLDGYSIKMDASFNGSTDESYFLVSVGQSLQLSDAGDKTIGILNFIGRNEIKVFAAELLGISPKKISSVKKINDLITLISLGMVQCIIASNTQYQYIKTMSKLDFRETECKKRVNIAVYAINNNDTIVTEKVKNMPRELTAFLGFDRWK